MKMLSTILWTISAIAAGYLLLVFVIYLLQSKLIYHPVSAVPYTPESIGLEYEDVYFTSKDGIQLHGWFVPADSGKGTVLFQHGNAGNISGRLETISMFHRMDLNVFIYDYRGYGRSEGSPSEQGTYSDALAAWHYLTDQRGVEESQIIIMGRSLGGAVTAWLATKVDPAGVAIESTFTSAPDLAAQLYPIFPVRKLIKYNYPNKQYIKDIYVPILIAHSREDDLIPFSHGEQLYELANEPKQFFEMKGRHGDGFLESGNVYRETLNKFFLDALEKEKLNKQQ